MAARKRKGLSEATRTRIKTTMLVKRLTEHALGGEDLMTVSQVNAARILLNKTLPDLSSIDMNADVSVSLPKKIPIELVKPK